MGRCYWNKKQESDSLKKIKIGLLVKKNKIDGYANGYLYWENKFTGERFTVNYTASLNTYPSIRLDYSLGEENNKAFYSYAVHLTTTPCNFGGQRYWFVCPAISEGVYCGKRVGVLYQGGDYFACRHCYKLTYEKRNETKSGLLYYLSSLMLNRKKAYELADKIKKQTYKGQPTKKLRQLDKMYRKMMPIAAKFKQLEKTKRY